MKKSVYLLLFIGFFGVFGIANAQLSNIPQTSVNVDMVPQAPKPNEVVQVSLTSFSTNIDTANIIWMVNGKTEKSGIGEKVFSFSAGGMGSLTTIGISVQTQEGDTIEKTLYIRPVSVDLYWESDGFVPPFYKGKALFVHQNKVTIVAIPHITASGGGEISAKSLVYTWKRNGSVVSDASGYGKYAYSFISPLISRPSTIDVEVATVDSSGFGYATLNLVPTDPSIVFYKIDPIYGIQFQKSFYGSVNLGDSQELTVLGIPLFFGAPDEASGNLLYKWLVNGVPASSDLSQSTQIFRKPEGTSGISNISLSIENQGKILQYTKNSFDLVFGNP